MGTELNDNEDLVHTWIIVRFTHKTFKKEIEFVSLMDKVTQINTRQG